jgi:hypothetical protein
MSAHLVNESSNLKGSHVTFAQTVNSDTTLIAREATTASSPPTEEPATPPWNKDDILTPPSSNINMTASSLPSQSKSQHTHLDASTSQINLQDTNASLPSSTDQSPSMQVHQRRAKRISGGSSSALEEAASTSQQPATERQSVLAEAHKDHDRGRPSTRERRGSLSGSRSRTPSPILGSVVDSNGHLSFAASLIPSAEEVRSLLYGQSEDKVKAGDVERPTEVTKDELKSLLDRVASMGFDKSDILLEGKSIGREEELAGMVSCHFEKSL